MRVALLSIVCCVFLVACGPTGSRTVGLSRAGDDQEDAAVSPGDDGGGGSRMPTGSGGGGAAGSMAGAGGRGGGGSGGTMAMDAAAGTGGAAGNTTPMDTGVPAMDAAAPKDMATPDMALSRPDVAPDGMPEVAPMQSTLSVTRAVATTVAVNLTAVGTIDWIHWGEPNATGVNRKNVAAHPISMLSAAAKLELYTKRAPKYSWTDGAPTTSATATPNGVFAFVSAGSGFEFTVAGAAGVTRTLALYVGVFEARAKLVASLSDNSATPYTDATLTSVGAPGEDVVYTITFRPISANVSLKVAWTLDQKFNAGNLTIQAAALR